MQSSTKQKFFDVAKIKIQFIAFISPDQGLIRNINSVISMAALALTEEVQNRILLSG